MGSVLSSCSSSAWLCSGVPCGVTAVRGAEMKGEWRGEGGDAESARLCEVGVLFGAPGCPCSNRVPVGAGSEQPPTSPWAARLGDRGLGGLRGH